MTENSYDVAILGCGPAGFYGALSCAAKGYRTIVIENSSPGGTGLRWGALPVKGGLDLFRSRGGFQSTGELRQSFRCRMNRAVDVEVRVVERLQKAGVAYRSGEPEIVSPRLVRIDSQSESRTISCRYLVLATGTSASAPPGFSLNGRSILSHKELLFRETVPERLEVLGGNVEGIELAYLYSGLKVPVRVTEMAETILPDTDPDLVEPLRRSMESMGVQFRTGFRAEKPEELSEDYSEENPILVTGFRRPNLPRGIELLEPELANGYIKVNGSLETSISGVYAVGDVNGIHGMSHVAIQQGIHLPKGFIGGAALRDYAGFPRAIFTIPEIAGEGLQENEIENPGDFEIIRVNLADTWRGFMRHEEGFIKLILRKDNELVGIWGVGREIAELISGFSLFIGKKVNAAEIHDTLFIHPTLSEAVLEAAVMKGL